MAGTVTLTQKGWRDGLLCYSIAWLSDASGNATGTISEIEGTIERIVYLPNTDSSTQPDDNYDVTLLDENGLDVLRGTGANLDETNASQVVPTGGDAAVLPHATCGLLALAVSGAGAANVGTIRLYFRR